MINKRKIFNDPVYGFISIPFEIIYDLIEHPYFQRLRNIKQLGLTHLVYPGALHTRFHHALGAMHLMGQALEVLRGKGTEITDDEAEAVTIAILLHDIGHGPFSHALEHGLIPKISHEEISKIMMEELNKEFPGKLSTAIRIFQDQYPKKFLHQLVSSQLDMDRMDYLNRDSFYTGVSEGIIGFDRILKMLTVVDDELLVEEKGIYSIEKFLIARRLMYWQVYYHKTVISAEQMLMKILDRAKYLAQQKVKLFCSPALEFFLYNQVGKNSFYEDPLCLKSFATLDDSDIHSAIKVWMNHPDSVLSLLCKKLIHRHLFKIEIADKEKSESDLQKLYQQVSLRLEKENIEKTEFNLSFFFFQDTIKNNAYNLEKGTIKVSMKDKTILDIAAASDNLNLTMLSKTVEKHFLCYLKL